MRFCRHFNPPPQESDVALVVLDNTIKSAKETTEVKKILKINVKQAHEYLGHLSKDTTRKMAKRLGMTLSRGSLPVCKPCTIAKAKQRNIPKETSGKNKATKFNS